MDLTFQPSYSEGWLWRGRKCARPVEDACSNPDLPLWAPWPWAYYATSLSLFFHLKDGSHYNSSQSCSKWYSILKFVLCSCQDAGIFASSKMICGDRPKCLEEAPLTFPAGPFPGLVFPLPRWLSPFLCWLKRLGVNSTRGGGCHHLESEKRKRVWNRTPVFRVQRRVKGQPGGSWAWECRKTQSQKWGQKS